MPFAAALSEHPLTAYATGEVCGGVLEQLGPHPDLAIVFVTLAHAGALEDVVATVREVLHPSVLIGAASDSIIGGGREVEGSAGISLWAGRFGPVLAVRLPGGLPDVLPFEPGALILVGDPFSVAPEELLTSLAARHPGLPVVGGMASGARGPGGSRLALDEEVFTSGAVAALVGPGLEVLPVVSQGCRPVGRPYVVTEGGGNIIRALAGRPALTRLDEVAAELTPEEIRAVNAGGLHLGRVLDEHKAEFGPGDFLVRQVLGGDREAGAVAVNDEVTVGTTVQFHIRDADAAHDDLETLLLDASDAADAPPDAALLFTCNGRGEHLFGVPDHDAGLLGDQLGPLPVTGFFAAGELGPVAGHNRLHSYTASMLLLTERRASPSG